jgi:hypothetical protein
VRRRHHVAENIHLSTMHNPLSDAIRYYSMPPWTNTSALVFAEHCPSSECISISGTTTHGRRSQLSHRTKIPKRPMVMRLSSFQSSSLSKLYLSQQARTQSLRFIHQHRHLRQTYPQHICSQYTYLNFAKDVCRCL